MLYDCVIVGGGIAGLQAAIQLGRYQHRVLVVDSNHGRSTLCKSYHNLLGWPNGVSGEELRSIGMIQAKEFGVEFIIDKIIQAKKKESLFFLSGIDGREYSSKRLLLSTGVMDRIPDFPKLFPCLGKSVYVCPDCDGYEVRNKRTIVMGSGNAGAQMALTLAYWTKDLIYVNHEQAPVHDSAMEQLLGNHIQYIEEPIADIMAEAESLHGIVLGSGREIISDRGFIAFGGNEVKSALARQLGVELLENQHILVNQRTKMTNVANVWAAGDVVAHSEQVSIAMGDGSQAAIWIHKSLLEQ